MALALRPPSLTSCLIRLTIFFQSERALNLPPPQICKVATTIPAQGYELLVVGIGGSQDDIARAAREANAQEFFDDLSEGLDTIVGENALVCRVASASASRLLVRY